MNDLYEIDKLHFIYIAVLLKKHFILRMFLYLLSIVMYNYLLIVGKLSSSVDIFDSKNLLKFIFYIFIHIQKLIIFFLNSLNYLSFVIINTSV